MSRCKVKIHLLSLNAKKLYITARADEASVVFRVRLYRFVSNPVFCMDEAAEIFDRPGFLPSVITSGCSFQRPLMPLVGNVTYSMGRSYES